ncbi:MAG: hypothetical protein DME26_05010 [Verrucomicrobia bacterium]|nr:MAG: hypothetical protein DME26_05010 [Verrucomicrobiota bacterium]
MEVHKNQGPTGRSSGRRILLALNKMRPEGGLHVICQLLRRKVSGMGPNVYRSLAANKGYTLTEIMIVVAVIALVAMIAVPSYVKVRGLARKAECRQNIRALKGAKETWAFEHHKTGAAVPSDSDIFGPTLYIVNKPKCPTGGEYSLNAVDEAPTCSDPEHHVSASPASDQAPENTTTSDQTSGDGTTALMFALWVLYKRDAPRHSDGERKPKRHPARRNIVGKRN